MTEPEHKEVKLAAKMRVIADADGLSVNHPLRSRASALDSCAALAFVPGGAPPGAHQAYRHAMADARATLRAYKCRAR